MGVLVGEGAQRALAPMGAAPTFAPVVVDELVRGDAVDPRPEPGAVGIEPIEIPVRPLERGRRDVLGGLSGPRPPMGESVDPVDVPTIEGGEGGRVVPGAGDQHEVVGDDRVIRIQVHRFRRPHGSSVWRIGATDLSRLTAPTRSAGRGRRRGSVGWGGADGVADPGSGTTRGGRTSAEYHHIPAQRQTSDAFHLRCLHPGRRDQDRDRDGLSGPRGTGTTAASSGPSAPRPPCAAASSRARPRPPGTPRPPRGGGRRRPSRARRAGGDPAPTPARAATCARAAPRTTPGPRPVRFAPRVRSTCMTTTSRTRRPTSTGAVPAPSTTPIAKSCERRSRATGPRTSSCAGGPHARRRAARRRRRSALVAGAVRAFVAVRHGVTPSGPSSSDRDRLARPATPRAPTAPAGRRSSATAPCFSSGTHRRIVVAGSGSAASSRLRGTHRSPPSTSRPSSRTSLRSSHRSSVGGRGRRRTLRPRAPRRRTRRRRRSTRRRAIHEPRT